MLGHFGSSDSVPCSHVGAVVPFRSWSFLIAEWPIWRCSVQPENTQPTSECQAGTCQRQSLSDVASPAPGCWERVLSFLVPGGERWEMWAGQRYRALWFHVKYNCNVYVTCIYIYMSYFFSRMVSTWLLSLKAHQERSEDGGHPWVVAAPERGSWSCSLSWRECPSQRRIQLAAVRQLVHLWSELFSVCLLYSKQTVFQKVPIRKKRSYFKAATHVFSQGFRAPSLEKGGPKTTKCLKLWELQMN